MLEPFCAVLEQVWKTGGKMDAWNEYFDEQRWLDAFEATGVDPAFYAYRARSTDEILPWSMIDVGVRPEHFKRERDLAYSAATTPDCRTKCSGCGAKLLSDRRVCDE